MRAFTSFSFFLVSALLLGTTIPNIQLIIPIVRADGANWWNSSWLYRFKITLDNSQINENLIEYPIPVIINGGQSAFWNHVKVDGSDIRFVDSDNVTILYYELESFTQANDNMVCWVKIPQVDANSNTDYFWIYYGNSAATFDNHCSSKDVWNTNYVGVWHLNQTSGNMKDATINLNNANETTATTGQQGKLDGACQFNGLTDYVSIPDSSSLDGMNSITIEFWAYQTTHHINRIISKQTSGGAATKAYMVQTYGDGGIYFAINNFQISNSSSNPYPLGSWYYVSCVYTGSVQSIYVDASLKGNATSSQGPINNSNYPLVFAKNPSSAVYFSGKLDEIRISKSSRSTEWIKACYQYEKDQSKISFGNEETFGPPSPAIYIDPASLATTLGNDCTVYVNVANVTDLYAWEFQLDYDPSILDLTSTSIVSGGLNEPTEIFYSLTDEVTGHLWWAVSSKYPALTGISYTEHAVFEINFHTIKTGVSSLHLHDTILSDSNADPMTHTITDGSVDVSAPAARDITPTNITVLNLGCSIYTNDTYANATLYYYPVEVTIHNLGNLDTGPFHVKLEVYWQTGGSTLEGQGELSVSNIAIGADSTVNFTAVFHPTHTGDYRLVAMVDSRNEIAESNETNNVIQKDDVRVTIMGDINGDQTVNILDAVIIALTWGYTPVDPYWNIKADISHDGAVNINDATRIGPHWGENW